MNSTQNPTESQIHKITGTNETDTVRLKYDDTVSNQKFSESELYPLIARICPRNTR